MDLFKKLFGRNKNERVDEAPVDKSPGNAPQQASPTLSREDRIKVIMTLGDSGNWNIMIF